MGRAQACTLLLLLVLTGEATAWSLPAFWRRKTVESAEPGSWLADADSEPEGPLHVPGTQEGGAARGEVPASEAGAGQEAAADEPYNPRPWVEPLSYKPRAYLFHNFLTHEECDHIIRLAKPFVKRSTVVGARGESVVDSYRTSYGTFIDRLADDTIAGIQQRVALWTKLNISHQEDMQVLRYGFSQQYKAHYDSLDDESPRTATVLMYLSDVEEGGETTFPKGSEWADEAYGAKLGRGLTKCAEGNVAMKPKKGDAMVFWSVRPDGRSVDPASLHTACPVHRGVKWVGIWWIHTEQFRPDSLYGRREREAIYRGDCEDLDALCADWAANGQCAKNAAFMLGDPVRLGACRAACGECEVCMPGDAACRNRNREKAGYLPLTIDEGLLRRRR